MPNNNNYSPPPALSLCLCCSAKSINYDLNFRSARAFASSAVSRSATNRGRRGLLCAETSSTAHRRWQPATRQFPKPDWFRSTNDAYRRINSSSCYCGGGAYNARPQRIVRTQLATDSVKVSPHDNNCFCESSAKMSLSLESHPRYPNGTNGWQKRTLSISLLYLY